MLNQWDCIEFNLSGPDPSWTAETCPASVPQHLVLAIANKSRAFGFVTWPPDPTIDRIGLIVPGSDVSCGVPLSALKNVVILPAVEFNDDGGHTYKIARSDSGTRIILRNSQTAHILPPEAVDALHQA